MKIIHPILNSSRKTIPIPCTGFFILTLVTAVLLQLACKQQNNSAELQATVQHVEENSNNLTSKEWDKYDLIVEETKEKLKIERSNYTLEETEKINKLIGKYYAIKTKNYLKSLQQEFVDYGNQVEGFFEGIADSTSKSNLK